MARKRKIPFFNHSSKLHLALFFGIFLFLGIIVSQMNSFKVGLGRAQSIDDTPVTKNVFLLIFNPIIESRSSQKLTSVKGWHDPDTLTSQILPAINQSSHGYITYSIVERLEVDGIFVKPDGYQYTDASYLDCVEGRGTCHQPDLINYQQLFTTYNVCSKNVDEVWIWGGPYFGYLEFNPVTYCGGKTQFVMGFNYERGIGEALHNFGHRMEYVGINRVGDGGWVQNEANEWNKFSLIAGHCGNIHYPPGSTVGVDEYNYNKTTNVQTDCNGYLNYPSGPFIQESINCTAWQCTQDGYVKWWLSHIPAIVGNTTIDGKFLYNNWWKYYAFFDETKTATPTPVDGTFSNLSSSMPKPGSASFTFDYSGVANNFIVDVSTLPDMSFDVYLTFTQGSQSPIVESNPGKWDKYSCGRSLYWRVKTDTGIQSAIQSQVVSCVTPTVTPMPTPSSTPVPTLAPANTATPTPIATATPTETPTPTVVPVSNVSPYITTRFLKIGRVRKPYFAIVAGQDMNAEDTLNLVLANLPTGLYQNNCTRSVTDNQSRIECSIAGEPTSRGLYYVKATITDSAGATRSKTLPLLIW